MKSITCIQAFREQSVKVNKHLLSSIWEMCGGFCVCVKYSRDIRTHTFGLTMEIMSQLEKITVCFISCDLNRGQFLCEYVLMCLRVDVSS